MLFCVATLEALEVLEALDFLEVLDFLRERPLPVPAPPRKCQVCGVYGCLCRMAGGVPKR